MCYTMWLGVIFVAAAGAPIPMYEYSGCSLVTDDRQGPCASVLTVAAAPGGGATAPLCCAYGDLHTYPDTDDALYYTPTASVPPAMLPNCEFIVTYALLPAAWCAAAYPPDTARDTSYWDPNSPPYYDL